MMALEQIKAQFETLHTASADLYIFLNAFRDWVNSSITNYEVFLEDNWFETHTTIEYIFRSLDTFDTLIFAEDEYKNSRDDKGVWHLGEYVQTRWVGENAWMQIEAFLQKNPSPQFKGDVSRA